MPTELVHRDPPSPLDAGIIKALIYADLFDYPLTAPEVHRYVERHAAPLDVVQEHLSASMWLRERLDVVPPFWFLAGRQALVDLRRQREAYSQRLWRSARRYGRWIAHLPLVRLVAVSGSLAVNNVSSAEDDIDLLIVTRYGRVWLARGMTLLVVHWARQRGTLLCPNYVVSEAHLRLGEPSLFTAHELAQMVPLYGAPWYRRLQDSNAWRAEYLPNASPRLDGVRDLGRGGQVFQRLTETALGGRLGEEFECWERERKVVRLSQQAAKRRVVEAQFTPDLCKGHLDAHAVAIQARYAARLEAQHLW